MSRCKEQKETNWETEERKNKSEEQKEKETDTSKGGKERMVRGFGKGE